MLNPKDKAALLEQALMDERYNHLVEYTKPLEKSLERI